MQTLQNIWDWFSGKKTNIGASLLTAVFLINLFNTEVTVGIWELTIPAAMTKAIATVQWIGAAFAGTGLIHKASK